MSKDCPVCEHPSRTPIEEALARGEPYKELKARFKVSIGAMKRHRRGCLAAASSGGGETAVGPRQEVYLRFGTVPKGGCSYNAEWEEHEEGLSVFRGFEEPDGSYLFDLPVGDLKLLGGLFYCMVGGRTLYAATGEEVGEGVTGGEPLLKNVTLRAVSPFSYVRLPTWLGEEARKAEGEYNRWRRNSKRRGREPPLHLREQVAYALEEAEALLDPAKALFGDREQARREARRAVRSAWKQRR